MLAIFEGIIKDNFFFGWFALLLFFLGFCSSYFVDYFDIKLLKAFPLWFMGLIIKYVNPSSKFIFIFLAIFSFNTISILLYMSSAIFIVPPFIITFLTGMNIGITVFLPQNVHSKGARKADAAHEYDLVREIPKGVARIMLFSTIVLFIEVLTFSLAMGMGMSMAVTISSNYHYIYVMSMLVGRLRDYLLVCVPCLLISAYLEATVIKG